MIILTEERSEVTPLILVMIILTEDGSQVGLYDDPAVAGLSVRPKHVLASHSIPSKSLNLRFPPPPTGQGNLLNMEVRLAWMMTQLWLDSAWELNREKMVVFSPGSVRTP